MQITELRVHPVAVADPPLRSSYGRHAPDALRTIVELCSTDGLIGISETYGGDQQVSRPRVVEMDPFQLTALWRDLTQVEPGDERSQTWMVPGENPADRGTRAFAAIEIACPDLIGRAIGEPLCDGVGGRARDAVPFSAYLFYKHGGGGGTGDDIRDDEYGEGLTPRGHGPPGPPNDREVLWITTSCLARWSAITNCRIASATMRRRCGST